MGRALGVGFDLGVGVGLGVAVGLAVDVAVAVGVGGGEIVAVAVGVDVAVAVAVAVDVGVGVPPIGAWIVTEIAPPVLKKPTSACRPLCGGACASNRKLYNVPQRIAFAFWFCANVSQLHAMNSTC